MKKQLEIWQDNYEIVGTIHGIGSMLAFEIIDPEANKPDKEKAIELVNLCHKKGLVILTCGKYGNTIRLLMPLIIHDEELEKGFKIIEENLQILEKRN